jgi:hypothetical protein
LKTQFLSWKRITVPAADVGALTYVNAHRVNVRSLKIWIEMMWLSALGSLAAAVQ